MEDTPSRMVFLAEEAELIVKAKNDEAAFNVLYDFYFPKIYGFVLKRVGKREEAEDIVSATFMKVFVNLDGYRPQAGASFSAWVYRIATNNIIDWQRKKKPSVNIEDIAEPGDERQDQHQDLLLSHDRSVVHKVLADLSEKEQRIITLKYFSELSHAEIASSLQVSEGNARVLLCRALRKFQQIYQKYA